MSYLKKLQESYSPEKRAMDRKENMFPYYIVRPISYVMTIPFLFFGVSANAVSIFSTVVAVFASILIAFGSYEMRIAGAGLVFLWIVLDCVDGNLARYYRKPSNKGAFLDAMGGYVVNATVFMAIGSSAYMQSGHVLFLYFGYLASISAILPRLLHQKWLNSVAPTNMYTSKGNRGLLAAIIQNIAAVSNFFQIFLILAIVLKIEGMLLFVYTLINVGILLYTVFAFLVRKE